MNSIRILTIIVISAVCALGVSGCRDSSGPRIEQYCGTEMYVLENDMVRVGILPALGGRIIELKRKGNDTNYFHEVKDVICKTLTQGRPIDETVGPDAQSHITYGGYEDTVTKEGLPWWPGHFYEFGYTVEGYSTDGEKQSLSLSAQQGSIRIDRVMTVTKNLPGVEVDIKYTNVSQEPIKFVLRSKPQFTLGTSGPEDFIIAPAGAGKVVKSRYKPADTSKYYLVNSDADSWLAAADSVSGQAVFVLFEPDKVSSNMDWLDSTGFFQLETWGNETMTNPGESTSMKVWFVPLSGLKDIDAASSDWAFNVAGHGNAGRGDLEVSLAAIRKNTPKLYLDISLMANEESVFTIKMKEIAPVKAGESYEFTQSSIDLPDGIDPADLLIKAALIDGDGKTFAAVEDKFTKEAYVSEESETIRHIGKTRTAALVFKSDSLVVSREVADRKVFQDEAIDSLAESPEGVDLTAAKNEGESFQLAMRSNQAIKDLSLVFSDLRMGENSISKDSFEWYQVEYVKFLDKKSGKTSDWPDVLVPVEKFDLPANRTQPVWINLYVPKATKAGDYKGSVKILSGETVLAQVDINLTVRDFSLPDETALKTSFNFWGPGLDGSLQKGYDYFKKHRITAFNVRGLPGINYERKVTDGKMAGYENFDAASHAEALRDTMARYNFNNSRIYQFPPDEWEGYPYGDEMYDKLFVDYWRLMAQAYEKAGIIDLVQIKVWDEPKPSDVSKVLHWSKLMRKASVKLQLFMTTPITHNLYGLVDWWCVPWGHLDRSLAKERQGLGEKVWLYNARLGVTNPNMRAVFWIIAKYNLDGYLHYAVDYTDTVWSTKIDDPWIWGQDNWATFFYPPRDSWNYESKPWVQSWKYASVRMELIREGLEDWVYQDMLKKRLEAVKDSGDSVVIAAAQAALANIDGLGTQKNYTSLPEDLYEARRQIGDAIELLNLVAAE